MDQGIASGIDEHADDVTVAHPQDTSASSEVPTVEERRLRAAALFWPAGVFVVALALSFWYYSNAWVHPSESWIGGQGDPEQQMWFMRWPMFALRHADNPFYTNYQLYPSGANLMWNSSNIVPGFLMIPVTAVWGPVVSYNVLMLLSPPATALTGYLAFRRWSIPLGAALGALLFAFCPFMMAHSSGHLHLIMLALVPLFLLLLDEILVRQSWPWWLSGGAFGVVAAAQLLTAEEILAIVGVIAVAGVIVLALLHRHRIREKLPYAGRALVVSLGAFFVISAYPLWVQFSGSNHVTQTIHGNNVFVTDLLNPLLPVNQKLRPDWVVKYVLNFSGNGSEWTGYLGLPLILILLTLLIWRWRQPAVLFSAVVGAIALLFSFGPWLHIDGHQYRIPMPWAPFTKAPVLHQLIPGRFSMPVALFTALGLAIAVTEIVRSRKAWLQALGVVAVAGVVAFWIPGWLPTTTVRTPSYFTSADVKKIPQGSLALVLPYVGSQPTQHAVLWQAESGMRFRMAEGWAIVPGDHAGPLTQTRLTFTRLTPTTTHIPEDQAARIRQELAKWNVQTIIVGPYSKTDPGSPQAAARVVEQIVGKAPANEGGVQVWYGLHF